MTLFLGAPVIQLIGNLAVDAWGATPCCQGIVAGVSLQTVLIAKLSAKQKEGNAGGDEGQQEVQAPTLTGLVSALAKQTAAAKCSAKTIH